MPIVVNELHSEVLEPPQRETPPPESGSAASLPSEWLQWQCLQRERQARLEED